MRKRKGKNEQMFVRTRYLIDFSSTISQKQRTRAISPDSHKSRTLKSAREAINYDLLFMPLQRV